MWPFRSLGEGKLKGNEGKVCDKKLFDVYGSGYQENIEGHVQSIEFRSRPFWMGITNLAFYKWCISF
jgi:hypothetical protein